jgi:hypothetical protein
MVFDNRTTGDPMASVAITPDQPSAVAALDQDIRSWLRTDREDWDTAVALAGSNGLVGGADLWDHMPALDSKVVARTSHLFKRHLGVPLDAKLIRPGGYKDDDDMIDDLIPKMLAFASRKSRQKRGMRNGR